MSTLTAATQLPGVTPAGSCNGCGKVQPVTALTVVEEAEHWSAMAWDPGYVLCAPCTTDVVPAATDAEVVALAAGIRRVEAEMGGDWTNPANPGHCDTTRVARQMLGLPTDDDAEARCAALLTALTSTT